MRTFFMTVCIAAAVMAAHAEPLHFYVAPNGNDAWSGKLDAPNAAGNDGPFATLAKARDAVRAVKASDGLTVPVEVQLRAGTYAITEPIVFTPEDSGTQDCPITYMAYPGEKPLITGGRPITGWREENGRWVADVPAIQKGGGWTFSALWVNDRRATPARTPNAAHDNGDEPVDSDYFFTEGPVMETGADGKEAKSSTKFKFRENTLQDWPGLKDAIVVVYHSWATSLMHVKNIDFQNRIIEFTGPARWNFGYWRNDQWFYVEHLMEGLDQPGEWCQDRAEGKVYYIPRPGETIGNAEIIAPVANQLILLEGSPAKGQSVDYLQFRGLTLAHTEYTIEPEGHSDGQAAFSVSGAFQTTGARHCAIEDCTLKHLGNYAVWFRSGSQENRAVRCEAVDLGAGGVRIGEGGNPASENEAAGHCLVDNCFLHDGGRIFREAVGVIVARSSYNTISHNEICDFRYSGLSIGWSWGYDESSANHNIIEYNHVHHIGHSQLGDMGGIYTLGVSPGTVIRYNIFHDVLSTPKLYGGWGIYFDEGSTGVVAENNLVYNTRTGTFHQHYGKENHVQNNIFAFSYGPQIIRSRQEEHTSFFFERNIVYFNNGSLLGSNWSNGKFALNDNCYWDTSGADPDYAGKTFDEWKALGFDTRSIWADPGFVNAEAGDFTLKPDSPALALGFKPFDVSTAGLYGDPAWVNLPKAIAREPYAPPPAPEPFTFQDDFESTATGELPANAQAHEEGQAQIRVTDETAAAGNHALKFTDAAGLVHAYNPHLVYTPNLTHGLVTGTFYIRPEPGGTFYHEWRDNHDPYRVGPSLWFNANGDLTVQGAKIIALPLQQWTKIEITCPLGNKTDGTFNLTVTLPGQAPQTFEKLACASTAFRRLDWAGFVSTVDAAATTYVDEISLSVK